jgi:type II secretory ATPase GspE/PulE/Tfp pilus assembly ATPase PilB-like protein
VAGLFRLIDLGVEPYLIVSTLIGISTQRMVRRICPHCRVEYKPTAEEIELFKSTLGEPPNLIYNRGSGCNLCANTGYQGRTGIFETLIISDTIRKMLVNNTSTVEIQAQALKEGLITMRQDGMQKVKLGIIPIGEVLRSVFSIG